jgi:hypothetical protein
MNRAPCAEQSTERNSRRNAGPYPRHVQGVGTGDSSPASVVCREWEPRVRQVSGKTSSVTFAIRVDPPTRTSSSI